MIIVRNMQPVSWTCQERTEQFGGSRTAPLFTFEIPAQRMVYLVLEDRLQDDPVQIIVTKGDPKNSSAPRGLGQWSLTTFYEFVAGVKEFVETATPYVKDGEFIVSGPITETTAILVGMKSPTGTQRAQDLRLYVSLSILELNLDWTRWRPDMLDPLLDLPSQIMSQREKFLSAVRARRNQ
jgi:hypothetical protein